MLSTTSATLNGQASALEPRPILPWTSPSSASTSPSSLSTTASSIFSVPPAVTTPYRPGVSVILADVQDPSVMTVVRHGVWGHRDWYIVAWLDSHFHRHEAFFSHDQLLPADSTDPALPASPSTALAA